MGMDRDRWISDAPISAPKPRDDLAVTRSVDLGGMIFTPGGIGLPVNTILHDQRYAPLWAPQTRSGQEPHGSTD